MIIRIKHPMIRVAIVITVVMSNLLIVLKSLSFSFISSLFEDFAAKILKLSFIVQKSFLCGLFALIVSISKLLKIPALEIVPFLICLWLSIALMSVMMLENRQCNRRLPVGGTPLSSSIVYLTGGGYFRLLSSSL